VGLFKEENFQVIIDPEIRIIPEFKKLITRDKDRQKRTAFAELAYVYFMLDYKSPYGLYPEHERSKRVRVEVALPEEWKPDKAVVAALRKYDKMQETPALKTLIAVKDSLITSSNVISALRDRIERSLIEDESDDPDAEPLDLSKLMGDVERLIKLSDLLPKSIKSMQNLEQEVKKEQSNERKIKGGGSTSLFED